MEGAIHIPRKQGLGRGNSKMNRAHWARVRVVIIKRGCCRFIKWEEKLLESSEGHNLTWSFKGSQWLQCREAISQFFGLRTFAFLISNWRSPKSFLWGTFRHFPQTVNRKEHTGNGIFQNLGASLERSLANVFLIK